MKLGLIAGNGRFPFLVLDAARSMGHEVTVVAIKEEAFKDLEEAAATPGPAASVHWISLGQLGGWLKILKQAGVSRAVMAGQVKHTKIFGGIVPDMIGLVGAEAHEVPEHRCDHCGRRRRDARARRRADRLHGAPAADAGK